MDQDDEPLYMKRSSSRNKTLTFKPEHQQV